MAWIFLDLSKILAGFSATRNIKFGGKPLCNLRRKNVDGQFPKYKAL
jgi:hypothetical protein